MLLADRLGQPVLYRYVSEHDDVGVVTDMLHEAYAPLAADGMHFLASFQNPRTTKFRMSMGETIVAFTDDVLVGIITLSEALETRGSPFYDRPDVAKFGQFAVKVSHQRRGIGSTLMQMVERRAAEKGLVQIALDTSEHAAELIALYQAKGYRFVEYVRWPDVNYRSMIFAKPLSPKP
jgi:GNAT superfamily N-acetyltransferase